MTANSDQRVELSQRQGGSTSNASPNQLGTDSEREYQELWRIFEHRSQTSERQYITREIYSIKILEMLVLMAVIAIAITVVNNFAVVGSLMVFALATLFSFAVSYWIDNPNQVRFWNQMLWCIIVPIACIFGDPFVLGTFVEGKPVEFNDGSLGVYFFVGFSILVLMLSWFVQPKGSAWLNAWLAGSLMACAVFMFVCGFLLLPISFLGMLSLIGLIGLTPLVSGTIFWNTSRMHLSWAKQKSKRWKDVYLMGLALPWFFFIILALLGQKEFLNQLIPS